MPHSHRKQHGFTSPLRSAEHGFTLVEMLIALSIFAMLSVAGVMLLRSSIDTQSAITSRLDGEGGLARLRALLGTELAAAQPRPHRDESGQRMPTLTGDGAALDFVYAIDAEAGSPAVARARYALEDGALVRRGSAHADGALASEPAIILRNVRSARWRYRSADGNWSERWSADNPARLPVAVELAVDSAAAPQLTLRFLVAPDGLAAPGTPPAGDGA